MSVARPVEISSFSRPYTCSDFRGRRIHMVGVGGAGMCGLAAVLLRRGARISGTDQRMSIELAKLAQLGAKITPQESGISLPADAELVVATAAMPDDHHELTDARRRGVLVLKYAEMLGLLMSAHVGVAVSGTHGKSTTTAWLAYALKRAGLDPSFVVGATVEQLGGGSGVGDGPHFVAEACEYARSFLNLRPRLAAILNIEADHLDYYAGLAAVTDAFSDFARLLPADGRLVVNGEDARCLEIIERTVAPIDTFGFADDCDWRATDIGVHAGLPTFDVVAHGRPLGRVRLGIAGRHNVLNALAVSALATACGIEWADIADALAAFRGAHRRLELRGTVDGVCVADDYAHHPTEIRATLLAARERFQPRRLWCVFQPHQYSRTRRLLNEFVGSFAAADFVIVPDIYAARDSTEDKQAVSAAQVAEMIEASGCKARHIAEFADIVDYLADHVTSGDLVITMGAGNIGKLADDLVQRLGGRVPA